MSSYFSAINKLWIQMGMRFYPKCYYIWPDFSVLANKQKLILNCCLKNDVASLEDIFLLSCLIVANHTISVASPGTQFRFTFSFCFRKNCSIQFFPVLLPATIQPCMEYHYHAWAGSLSCYLELLDNLQKWICRTVGPLLAALLEPLAHHWNAANLSLFYRYYLCRGSSELAQLVPLSYTWGRSMCYSDR